MYKGVCTKVFFPILNPIRATSFHWRVSRSLLFIFQSSNWLTCWALQGNTSCFCSQGYLPLKTDGLSYFWKLKVIVCNKCSCRELTATWKGKNSNLSVSYHVQCSGDGSRTLALCCANAFRSVKHETFQILFLMKAWDDIEFVVLVKVTIVLTCLPTAELYLLGFKQIMNHTNQ